MLSNNSMRRPRCPGVLRFFFLRREFGASLVFCSTLGVSGSLLPRNQTEKMVLKWQWVKT